MGSLDYRLPAFIVTVAFALSSSASGETSVLSQNLQVKISNKIDGVSAEEKEMIAGWAPAKKLSEFFCQDRALAEFGKTYPGADRVFMSVSEDAPPVFMGDNRIKGDGSVRYDAGWTDITYECEVDPDTGEATEFVFESKS